MGLIGIALLAAGPTRGEEKETVQVSVLAILATEHNDRIDPKLTCIAKEVRRTHDKLTGFQVVRMTRRSLALGTRETFELVEDQKVAVAVQHGADEKNRVEVRIAPPRMGEITYDTCCGKFLPIVTPYRTENKDLLIIAVRVQPCHVK
jgi:hypothetical protein